MTDDNTVQVLDEPAQSRFVATIEGHEAQLRYRTEEGRLVLTHTEVPEELGGRGIAGQLVATAVQRAADTGETIAPWCPYARAWLEKHPDEAARISIDWTPPPAH